MTEQTRVVFYGPLTKSTTAQLYFDGPMTKAAIEKLKKILELMEDILDDELCMGTAQEPIQTPAAEARDIETPSAEPGPLEVPSMPINGESNGSSYQTEEHTPGTQ